MSPKWAGPRLKFLFDFVIVFPVKELKNERRYRDFFDLKHYL